MACEQARIWRDLSGRWLPLAVNVSALQVVNREFGDIAIRILRESGLPPGVIELELTESALMTDVAHGARLMQELKRAGFSIALDDFGTGYSSLSYLRQLPVRRLKIDRSFIKDLPGQEHSRTIVTAIVALAHGLGLQITAEGVETPEQADYLVRQGCDVLQGYLFARPMPDAQLQALLQGAPRV